MEPVHPNEHPRVPGLARYRSTPYWIEHGAVQRWSLIFKIPTGLPEPLKSDLLTYSERFRVHITKDWDEGSNLASTEARNKLVELRLASTHGDTDGMAAGTTAASEATHGAAVTGS